MILNRSKSYLLVGIAAALLFVISPGAWSHGYAGKRIFPTTLAIEDPFVMDEFSVLTSYIKESASEELPATLATAISAEYTARITPRLGILLGGELRHLERNGKDTLDGFGNLEVGAKYQFFTSTKHEAIASVGLSADVGGTGDRHVGAAPFSTLTPTLFFGKGMGDLPESAEYLRPLAVTGVFGGSFSTDARTIVLRPRESGVIERETTRNPTMLHCGA